MVPVRPGPMTLLILLALPSPDRDTNVALDDERLQDNVPKGLQKVELDLDDALFLEFEEKEPPPAAAAVHAEPEPEPIAEEPAPPTGTPTPARPGRKKLLFFGLAAALCLFLGAGGAYYFMSTGLQPAADQMHPAQNQTAAGKDDSASAPMQTATYPFDRFQVEYVDDNQIRFLTCRFSIPSANATLRLELDNKNIIIRDAVYRYLKGAPLTFLSDQGNVEQFKTDVAAVINRHLGNGRVTTIHLQEYVVK